jgi:hypothetical protein
MRIKMEPFRCFDPQDGDRNEKEVKLTAWEAYNILWTYASPLDVILCICGTVAACAGRHTVW